MIEATAITTTARRSVSAAVLAGSLVAPLATGAAAAERTVLLNYACASYDSARRVAISGGWNRPTAMPTDCDYLAERSKEHRMATVIEIIEVFRSGPDRWIEVGRVRRLYGTTSYSAGFVDEPLVF